MKRSITDKRFDIGVVILLLFLLLVVAYPLYFVIIASVSDPAKVSQGKVLLYPIGITLEGYRKVIEYSQIWVGYRNTLVYVVCYTVLSVGLTLMAGYAVSRRTLPGRKGIMLCMVFTMFFSGGLIPTYLLINQLGLVGNPLIVVLMGAVNVYNIIIARTFIQSAIPEDMFEAAAIDGCSHARFFMNVVVPLSPALIAVLTLFAAVAQWNSWFNAMIYLRDKSHMPLQIVVRELIVSESSLANNTEAGDMMGENAALQALLVESMKYALIIVSTLPIMLVYPFLQKYFVKGIMVGSIKG